MDFTGCTPMHHAISGGHITCAELLVRHGCAVQVPSLSPQCALNLQTLTLYLSCSPSCSHEGHNSGYGHIGGAYSTFRLCAPAHMLHGVLHRANGVLPFAGARYGRSYPITLSMCQPHHQDMRVAPQSHRAEVMKQQPWHTRASEAILGTPTFMGQG